VRDSKQIYIFLSVVQLLEKLKEALYIWGRAYRVQKWWVVHHDPNFGDSHGPKFTTFSV